MTSQSLVNPGFCCQCDLYMPLVQSGKISRLPLPELLLADAHIWSKVPSTHHLAEEALMKQHMLRQVRTCEDHTTSGEPSPRQRRLQ
eukprot:1785074-Amphidinium_carterae.1